MLASAILRLCLPASVDVASAACERSCEAARACAIFRRGGIGGVAARCEGWRCPRCRPPALRFVARRWGRLRGDLSSRSLLPLAPLRRRIHPLEGPGRVASSAPPSPSRHDPWRFLRCVDLRNRDRAGPYCSLGRVRASFAPGLDPVAGRPLLRGAATLQRLVWLGLQRFCV